MTTRFLDTVWSRSICILLVVIMFPIPAFSQPQRATVMQPTSEVEQTTMEPDPCFAAQQDASNDVNKPLWFLAGCLIGVTGILLAYLVAPSAPQSRLIGKSPEWVAAYADCYERKGKSAQGSAAVTGCLVNVVAAIVYVVVVFSAASTVE